MNNFPKCLCRCAGKGSVICIRYNLVEKSGEFRLFVCSVGGGLYFVGRVIVFLNKVLGGLLFFLPKLREGHNYNFLSQS